MTKNAIVAVDEDDMRYLIYTSDELREIMDTNPEFSNELSELLYERWIPARNHHGKPVWLNINRLKRLEFVELKYVKE